MGTPQSKDTCEGTGAHAQAHSGGEEMIKKEEAAAVEYETRNRKKKKNKTTSYAATPASCASTNLTRCKSRGVGTKTWGGEVCGLKLSQVKEERCFP